MELPLTTWALEPCRPQEESEMQSQLFSGAWSQTQSHNCEALPALGHRTTGRAIGQAKGQVARVFSGSSRQGESCLVYYLSSN